MTCEKCGEELAIGGWPYCPHGAYGGGVVGDDIPGGLVIENLGHHPVKFYSKQAIVKEADARGLRHTDKWAGPGDKHLTNWAAGIDAYTLAAAAALVTRRALRSRPEPPDDIQCETAQFSVSERKADV